MIFGPELGLLLVKCCVHVAFIPNQQQLSIGWSRLSQLVPFGGDCGEWGRTGEVKNQHNSITSFEVIGYYRSVLLLSGSIPYIQLDSLILDVDLFDLEVDGGDGGGVI